MTAAAPSRLRWTAAAITVARLSQPLLNVLFVVLLARVGGAAVLGDYTFLLTLYLLLEQVKSLGLQNHLLRQAAAGQEGMADLRAALVRLGCFGAAAGSLLLALACLGNAALLPAALLLSAGLFASAWTVANEALLLASGQATATATIAVAEGLVRLLLSLALILCWGPSLVALAAIHALTRIASACAQNHYLRTTGAGQVQPGAIAALLRLSPSMFTIYVAPVILFRLDVVILGLFRGSEEVGVYGAAIRLIAAAMILPDSLLQATFVRLSQLAPAEPAGLSALFHRTVKLLTLALLPASLGVSLLAPWLLPWLFGARYHGSVLPLQILIWSLLPYSLARAAGDRLIAHGRQNAVARAILAAVACGLPLYLFLIPAWGAAGAAFGFVATAILLAIFAAIPLWRRERSPLSPRPAAAVSLALVTLLCSSCGGAVAARNHAIIVKPQQTTGTVSPLLFGAAVEWTDNGNTLYSPERGALRQDLIDLLKPLRISVWRFPGGILSDHYHWQDGVGPRAQRPKRPHPMEDTTHENNFGTDEFIAFCRAVDGQALLTLNFGTGSLDEALQWQRYFQEKHFPIRYFEVGNEIYLTEPMDKAPIPGNDQRIFHTGTRYSAEFKRWAAALRQADPQALVGAIAGTYNTGSKHKRWLYDLLGQGGRDVDFIALHNSFAPIITSRWDYQSAGKRHEAYAAMFAHTQAVSLDVRGVTKGFRESGPRSEPRIAITEHFPLFGAGGGQLTEMLDQSRTQASALYTASLFHTWMRDGVWMANYNIAVSKWFGALITDTPQGPVRTPTYHVFDLYRNYFGTTLVATTVNGPTFSTAKVGMVAATRNVPTLDALASTQPDGTLSLAVINRNLAAAETADLQVEGMPSSREAQVFTLSASAAHAINGPSLTATTVGGSPTHVAPQRSSWKNAKSYSFPPHSITLFRWKNANPPRP